MKLPLVALLVLLGARPLVGQALGGNEYVAGAALNVALRGPYVAKPWRAVIPRAALGLAISCAYERFIDVNGWNSRDVAGRVAGYALTEIVLTIGRKVLR